MDRAQSELAAFAAAWTALSFALYEQGDDGVWRKMREYPFGREGFSSLPQQQSVRAATRL
jgi:hypothetical protein